MDKNEVYDLNLYKIFYVATLCKSFSETANKLNITQPAVSYSIKQLEDQLNVQLFNRANNGIDLTEEGKALLFYVEKVNNLIKTSSKVIEEMRNETIKEINIGVPTHIGTFYFINYLIEFHSLYPNVKVNIVNKKTSEMLSMVENKELDLLIDTDIVESNNKDIKIEKLKDLNGCFIGNSKFQMLSEKEKISAKELSLYPLILPSLSTTTRKLIDAYFRRKNVLLNPIIETNSSSISKRIIKTGIGIGWMIKEFVQEDIGKKELFTINVDVDNVKTPICIAYQEKYLNKVIKDFINIFKDDQSTM